MPSARRDSNSLQRGGGSFISRFQFKSANILFPGQISPTQSLVGGPKAQIPIRKSDKDLRQSDRVLQCLFIKSMIFELFDALQHRVPQRRLQLPVVRKFLKPPQEFLFCQGSLPERFGVGVA